MRIISNRLLSVQTITTQKSFAIETALFLLAKSATDLTTIATLLNSEKTEYAIVKKTGR